MDTYKDVRGPAEPADRLREWSPDPAEVANLAYSYYLEREYRHGSHEDDWHRAERELRTRYEQQRQAVSSPVVSGQWSVVSDAPGDSARDSASNERAIVGVFHSLDDAQQAFDDLGAEGFSRDEVSLIANQTTAADSVILPDEPPIASTGHTAEIGTDAGIGAAVGGVGGLLLSLAGLAVPGIGPVLAAGPIIAALGGAGLGAAAGGLIGALTGRGVPEERAEYYAEGVRRGGILVTVQASGDQADRAAEILDRNSAVDIDRRVSDWRERGWTGHDTNAQPLDASELDREREYFRAAAQQAREWSEEGKSSTASSARAARIY